MNIRFSNTELTHGFENRLTCDGGEGMTGVDSRENERRTVADSKCNQFKEVCSTEVQKNKDTAVRGRGAQRGVFLKVRDKVFDVDINDALEE